MRNLKTRLNFYEENCCLFYFQRLHVSVYIAHVVEWMRVFPKEQLLFLRTEDWHYHKQTDMLQNIFKFLDIGMYN